MIRGMATRDRPLDRGNRTARPRWSPQQPEELRRARTNGGLSQREVAQAAGVSHATVSRIERAASPEASLIVLARLASVVGLEPGFASIRTAIHSETSATFSCWSGFRSRIHPDLRWSRGALLSPGDLRAWDSDDHAVRGHPSSAVEAEMRSSRTSRRAAPRHELKAERRELDRVIWLVAGTRRNRRRSGSGSEERRAHVSSLPARRHSGAAPGPTSGWKSIILV